ncbi:MAG: type II toxin-antitoxin system HipA family toxin, partial [Hymenobacter sp.]
MNCPGCYRPLRGANIRFCPNCASLLFDGQAVNPVLSFTAQDLPSVLREDLIQIIKRISISGFQFKATMRLGADALVLSAERGNYEYLLKPPPRSFTIQQTDLLPANEHFTMQLAKQIFRLRVADCALLPLADGQPAAYLARRFDVLPTGERLLQEDFAQLTGCSRATHGENFK